MTGLVADIINAVIVVGFVFGGFMVGRWYEQQRKNRKA